ncbi:unnamed protein product [Cuscuta epithymum]|uniref:Uncharacterized protein n=1 Tax=Cuscuta epithymum TaxID=186058 RepID=A0AAV0FE94_9ASTE|nr:unnamed protein product [Cuscuta epithymum]CAH9133667.1 unnamed protein product [Cuscuta epithymum]
MDKRLIQVMQSKLSGSPKLLTKSAGRSKCCIFRVTQGFFTSMAEVDERPYRPRAVSIGPYHHGKPQLKMMQEHKWRFLERVVKRTMEEKGVGLEEYVKAVRGLEEEARECYSEAIDLTGDEFVEMLVLDGCFVVEILRAFTRVVPFEEDDPFLTMQWILVSLRDDILCLENQIPFFVLQTLFTLTETGSDRVGSSLASTALMFFNAPVEVAGHPEVIMGHLGTDFEVLHLLNLHRRSYFPVCPDRPRAPSGSRLNCFPRSCRPKVTRNIQSISKLRRAGIKLKLKQDERSFMRVNFERGVIRMPLLALEDTMCAFLLNCVAFEQCHQGGDKLVSDYACFLVCLIESQEDVDILCEAKVLHNHLATAGDAAAFVGKLSMGAVAAVDDSYLRVVCDGVNHRYDNNLHIYWAEVMHQYFSSPWSLMSLLAAIFLLFLTLVQTIFTVWDFEKES